MNTGMDSECPASLPRGWSRVTVSEIAHVIRGVTYDKESSFKEPHQDYVPILRAHNINGEVNCNNLVYVDGAFVSSDQMIKNGDILVCMSSGSKALVGKAAQAKSDFDYAFGAFCSIIRPLPSVESRFLGYYFQGGTYRKLIAGLSSGVNINNLRREHIEEIALPLAPLYEQQRIVAKIDELFSELDAAVTSLKRARVLLKKYRQAVLKAAMTGELTRNWRERHKGEIRERGAELLQRILKARRAAWEAAELKKLRAKGKPPRDDRWKQKYKEPQPPHTAGLPDLPEGWVWTTLDALAEVVGGVTKDAKREARGGVSVPYLRVANVQRGYLDLTKIKEIIVDTDTVASLRLIKNDILFNEGGDIDKLGRGWIWQDELPACIYQNHVFRARLHLPEFSAKFVSWFANAIGQEYFMREGKQTTNLASISLSKLKVFPVPVPPCEEIAEIEAELERQLTVLDAFEVLAEQETRRCSALRQSILKAAFAGRLVAQDPNDEPASVLLERIRAERAAKPRPARGRRRRKTIESPEQLELPA